MTKRSRKALIIGGGIAGPVTAILLKRAGFDAAIYEAFPYSTGIGGGLQIAPNGMHVLAEIGLAAELTRGGSICESIDFYSQSGAPLGSVNRNMAQRFGQPAVSMRRAKALTSSLPAFAKAIFAKLMSTSFAMRNRPTLRASLKKKLLRLIASDADRDRIPAAPIVEQFLTRAHVLE